jgi:PAS domain S-box-containing protein
MLERTSMDRTQGMGALIEEGGIPVAILDGDRDYVEVSPAAATLMGYTSDELIENNALMFVHPDDRSHLSEKLGHVESKTGNTTEVTFRHQQPNGEYLWFKCVIANTSVHGVSILYQDITESKFHEESNRRKDEFIAVLAHELRNPLAAIKNVVSIIRHSVPDDPTYESVHDCVQILSSQTDHVVRLSEDLLDMAAIVRGKIRINRERMMVCNSMERAAATVKVQMERKNIDFKVTLPELILIEADHTRIEQVLVNLLANAAKYTDPGDKVEFMARMAGKEVRIDVKDNGIGIRPSKLSNIFEIFHQEETGTRGGLGIGLTLVRRLVELHDGRISAVSGGLGKGSLFSIYLPARLASECNAIKAPGAVEPINPRLRIMVVEDNPDLAKSMVKLLKISGHTVDVAYDGASALAAMQDFRPDVLLCDLGLPGGIDGLEVARRSRLRGDTFHMVLLSGYLSEKDQREAYDAGYNKILSKPLDFVVLDAYLASSPL